MKKIFVMFFSAVLSFMLFSYIDEYENLIVPLFKDGNKGYAELFDPKEDNKRMEDFLVNFNNVLYTAYRKSDPSKISDLPISDNLQKTIVEEILFHRKNDRTMDMVLRGLTVIKITRPSQLVIEAHVREKVALRSLVGDELQPSSRPYEESEQTVTYLLTIGERGFEVSSYDITSAKVLGRSL